MIPLSDLARLRAAIELAHTAHRTQLDKAGDPYLWHVLRVGISLLPDVDAAELGILHDVLEDRPEMAGTLAALLGNDESRMLDIDALSRRPGEPYAAYIERVKARPLAKKVKLADLADNMNPSRWQRAAEVEGHLKAHNRQLRYQLALAVLLAPEENMTPCHRPLVFPQKNCIDTEN